MIEIPLSKTGKHAGKYTAIVDEADADLAEVNWSILSLKKPYATRKVSQSEKVLMHRVIFARMFSDISDDTQVDHINGDKLDNRRSNLRLATHSENIRNRKQLKTNSTGFKGVSYRKNRNQTKRWEAKIGTGGKTYFLGAFMTPEEAHEAYCQKGKELFGDFFNAGERKDAA